LSGIVGNTGLQLADGNRTAALQQAAAILAYVGAHPTTHLRQRTGSGKDLGSPDEVSLAEEPESFRYIVTGRASQHTGLRFGALDTARSFGHGVLLTIAHDYFFEILNPFLNGTQGVLNSFAKNACSTINVSVTGFGTHNSLRLDTLTRVVLKPVKGCWEHEERNWVTLVSSLSIVKGAPNWQ
jgi:hypothetical protein